MKLPSKVTFALTLLGLLLSSCTFSLLDLPAFNSTPVPPTAPGPTPTPLPAAAVTFNVTLPSPLLPGETLYLSVVDEVTGVSLNPINHAMQAMDATHYTLTLPFAIGTVLTYRYLRQAVLPVFEDDSSDRLVRYRMYYVAAPGIVQDVVSSWTDSPFSAPTGRVTGTVVNAADGKPVPNILIAIGGQQTLTDTTGSFIIEGLPAGTHNLVAYALDGAYQTFQQGAIVVEGKTTPANISLTPSSFVNVTFTVTVPEDTVGNAPIRLAGNLSSLGNTFGDLNAGVSTVASRMPVLSPVGGRVYTITLSLPVGADIRYKYTLGDGYWNAEHAPGGAFVLRQLILPPGQPLYQVQDYVSTWQDSVSSPILFEVTVPPETPVSDIVSIQFNPYGWMEPIPMWPMGGNRWIYRLYSPFRGLNTFQYRYCRNDQCGVADDVATPSDRPGRLVTPALAPQDLQDSVTAWKWYASPPPTSLVGLPVAVRPVGFWAGVEFLPGSDPTWQAWMSNAILNVQALYSNWIVLTPSWTVSRTQPLVFAPLPGRGPLYADLTRQVNGIRSLDLNAAIFPQANLPIATLDWWKNAPRDEAWWNAWFERYQTFAIHHADLAAQTGASALILGGDWVMPALPGGRIGAESSGVPENASARWTIILQEVRAHYSGNVLWAVPYPDGMDNVPDFVSSLDGIYLLWYTPLASSGSASVDEMRTAAGVLLDTEVLPLQQAFNKPIILAVAYPSADGAATAWMPLPLALQPGNGQGTVDLQEQADLYQALLAAVNERPWIGGFVSRGYYPPVVVHDTSASVYGKPAADVLWYWYPRFLGLTP